MATIAAGGIATVTCPAGTGLTFSGGATGLITYLTPGIHPGSSTTLANRNAIGPFSSVQALSIQVDAGSAPLSYISMGPLSSPQFDAAKGSLSVGGKPVLSGDTRTKRSLGNVGVRLTGRIDRSTNANFTYHASFYVPFKFYAVQVRALHNNTALWAALNVAMACTSSFTSSASALVTPDGAWTQVITTTDVPASVANGNTTSATYGVLTSAIVPLASIDRADGDSGSNVMVRTFWTTGPGSISSALPNTVAPSKNNITPWKTYQSGDFCTTNQAGLTSLTPRSESPPIEFLFWTATGVKSMAFYGDSIDAGLQDSTNFGWVNTLGSASSGSIAIWNGGVSSMTSNAYLANLQVSLPWIRPHMAEFRPWSPNDTDKYTTTGEARVMQGAATFLALCDQYNIIPVLATPLPVGGLSDPNQEASRRRVAVLIRNMLPTLQVLDWDLLMTDYSTNLGGYKAGLNFDTLHPNALGYSVMAGVAESQLMPMFGL